MKTLYHLLTLVAIIIMAASCGNETEEDVNIKKILDPKLGYVTQELADNLAALQEPTQKMLIDAGKDNVLTGIKGTVIYIKANSLVDANGESYTGQATIELEEYYTLADQLLANLQTLHNGQLLQTQGMLHITAMAEDSSALGIHPDQPVRIEIPVKEKVSTAKIFTGERDSTGNMNWGDIIEPNNLLVPLPIRSVASSKFHATWSSCPEGFAITNDKKVWEWEYAAHYYKSGNLSDYENTLLATREFRERYYEDCDAHMLKLYTGNLDMNMWEIDEMMVEYLIEDSIRRVQNYVAGTQTVIVNPKKLETGDVEEAAELDELKQILHDKIVAFKKFAAQKLTKIDTNRLVSDTTIGEFNNFFVAYDALDFGWVNVDYFFADSTAKPVRLLVQVNEPGSMVQLVLPNQDIIMSGIQQTDSTYAFTKSSDGLATLPVGEKAVVFTMAFVDNHLLFSLHPFTIGEEELIEVEPDYYEEDLIKLRLNSLRYNLEDPSL